MYRVILTKRAEKSLTALPEDVQSRCGDVFDELQYSFAPIRLNVKKIKGHTGTYRIRLGVGALSITLIKRTNWL